MHEVFQGDRVSAIVLRLGIPAMMGQLTTLIYNIADTYFVSLTKEPAQIAAVTLCMPILLLLLSIAAIFGMGGSSVIARQLGEGKDDQAAKCLNFCTYGMVAAGVLAMAAGLAFTGQLAALLGADRENLTYTCDYLTWIFVGAPALMIGNGMVHLFRSVGLIRQATIGLAMGNGINILLDWVFIVLLDMGTAGAAIATSLGFACASVYYIFCLLCQQKKGNVLVDLSVKHLSLEGKLVGSVVQIGIPGALITVLMSVGNIVMNNFIGIYGSDAVASYGIAYKIDMISVMLSLGLSQGTAPLVGYYYGQREEKKLVQAMGYATAYGILLGLVCMAALLCFRVPLVSVFLQDGTLIAQTAWFLTLLCLHAPLLSVINMVTAYFQSLGKAVHSLTITVLRNILLFIPGVYLLNHFFHLNGVILTQFAVELILTGICILLYLANQPKRLLSK